MTRKQLERTAWAKKLKKICTMDAYLNAIRIAMDNNIRVRIYKTYETGELRWAIDSGDDFWLDSFKTKKQAISLCKKMGWKIYES